MIHHPFREDVVIMMKERFRAGQAVRILSFRRMRSFRGMGHWPSCKSHLLMGIATRQLAVKRFPL